MITNSPSLDLMEFVETQILPRYADFDRAHNLEHVTRVIRRSMESLRHCCLSRSGYVGPARHPPSDGWKDTRQ